LAEWDDSPGGGLKMKIKKLTPQQEALIPVVREEWIKFCLGGNTEINRKVASDGIRWIYGLAELESPLVVFVDGPMACQYAVWFIQAMLKDKKLGNQVGDQVGDQVRDQVRAQVGAQVWGQVRDQVRDQVWNQVRDQVWGQVWDQVRDQVGAQVWDQVGDQVGTQVWDQVGDQVKAQVRDQVGTQGKGSFNQYTWCDLSWSGWIAFYEFFRKIGVKVTKDFERYADYTRSGAFMTIFLRGFAIVCPRPSLVHRNANNQLHKDMAPAIEWANGEGYYFLNGVRMKKEQVMTPAEKLDVGSIVNEQNVEVRRELIRKIGIERFVLKSGAKVLDKQGDYELLSVRLSDDVPDARYLKMKNPSIATWHVEGVEGNTVQEAINWRAGNVKENWEPCVLT
jgi:hypothetical protein